MRILFISHRLPYPPNKGDKIRSFNIIKELSRRHDLFLACPVDEIDDLYTTKGLDEYVKSIFIRRIRPNFQKAKGLLLSLTGRPITVTYFYSSALQKDIDCFLDVTDVDVIFCYSSPSAEYLFRSRHFKRKMSKALWVMDLIDVDSQKWSQYAASSQQPMKMIYESEAKSLQAYEKEITCVFDHTLLVSSSEKRILEKTIPGSSALSVYNGVDLSYFKPISKKTYSNCIVFTGLMDYRPNIDAVVWFAEKVFPRIKKKIPDISFCIVGHRPSSRVRALESITGIKVTGYVEDIRYYLSKADVCVVPIKIARGIQNKVLEAMAMGKAVVCTPQALEGIDAIPGKQLMVADTVESFAFETERLIRDKSFNQELGKNARFFVEEHFSWQKNLSLLEQLFTSRLKKCTALI